MFTPAELRDLRVKMNGYLQEFARANGLEKVEIGNGSYDSDGHCTWKVTVTQAGAVNPHAAAFQRNAHLFGFEPEDLGKTVTLNGRAHEIVGLNPRATRMPVLTRCLSDGKTYKYEESAVLRALGRPTRSFGLTEVLISELIVAAPPRS